MANGFDQTALAAALKTLFEGSPASREAAADGIALALVDNYTGEGSTASHHGLTELNTYDDHTRYAQLDGRAGGQTLIGGTASSNVLTLSSTSDSTKGAIKLGTKGAFDEVNGRLGIGIQASIADRIHIFDSGNNSIGLRTDTNRTTEGNELFSLRSYWNSNQVADLKFLAGPDTTNKDDATFSIKLAAAGSLAEVMAINDLGIHSFPKTSRFDVDSSTADPMTTGTWTPVPYDNSVIDTRSEITLDVGNDTYFTALVAGFYQFNWCVGSSSEAWAEGDQWIAALQRNGSLAEGNMWFGKPWYAPSTASYYAISAGSKGVYLAAGAVMRIKVYHDRGSSTNTSGEKYSQYFDGHKSS